MTPIFRKGQKDDPGSYRPVSLTSVLGKVMEQIMLGAIVDQLKAKQGIRPKSAWVYKLQLLSDKPDFILWQGDPLSG